MQYRLSLAVLLLAATTAAQATPTYSYSTADFGGQVDPIGGVSTSGGNILTLDTSYNTGTGDFTWDYTTDTTDHNGFWLVVSDGENPKYDVGEYAILYADIAGGQVSAFEYNGQNAPNSFNTPGNSLGFFENAISSNTTASITSVSLSINVSSINSAYDTDTWDGVNYDDSLGIWFHPTRGASFGYDTTTGGPGGTLVSFNRGSGGYYDTENDNGLSTNKVPEPASLALLLAGGIGFVSSRKKQR